MSLGQSSRIELKHPREPSAPSDPFDILEDLNPIEVMRIARVDPGLYLELIARQNCRDFELERKEYEDSLIAFFIRAWREIEHKPLSLNWHHEKIAETLENITWGEIRNVIINEPPRHTKTTLTNIIWPAWVWAQPEILPLSGAHVKFLCVSYGATLSEEIAVKMRRLVMGDWYQTHWGDRVHILEDQKSRANFGNTAGGERMSTSIEGGVLGRGGDIIIIDDPQTRRGADSAAERAASLQGMSDLMTRITDPRISAMVLVMQRLHLLDATDWALKNWPRDTVHLMYPARFDPGRACESDPRTQEGELLWPEVWTDEELTKIETGMAALDGEVLSSYAVSGQMQQNPIPRGGGIINKDDWKIWPEWEPRADEVKIGADGSTYIPLPEVSHVILSLDTAISLKDTADWNACVVMGIWHRRRNLVQIVGQEPVLDDGEQPRVIVMGAWRRRCRLNDDTLGFDGKPQGLVQRVIATGRQFNADRVIIENKTRGQDVKNEIERQLRDLPFRLQMFNPKKHGDKAARLNAVQPQFSQGLVYMPGRARLLRDRAGHQYVRIDEFAWANDIMEEVEAVPRGAHDDLADCISMGLLCLREEGFLALTDEYVSQHVAARMFQGRRTNVRDAYGV